MLIQIAKQFEVLHGHPVRTGFEFYVKRATLVGGTNGFNVIFVRPSYSDVNVVFRSLFSRIFTIVIGI